MKQLLTALCILIVGSALGQSAQIRNTLEFQLNASSATVANFGAEIRYAHRVNPHVKLWNWEYYAGAGLWGYPDHNGAHGIAAFRTAFGKRRHQVLGDLGAVYLFELGESRNTYGLPILNLGYRYTAKTDDWHLQLTAGTWGIVSLNLGLKW